MIAQIKNRNYKFIIYMDDLSFEEFEIEYKYLKAVRITQNITNVYHIIKMRETSKKTVKTDRNFITIDANKSNK